MIGRQLPFFSLIVPFWLIWVFAGFRGMIQIWPAILVCRRLLRDPAVPDLELRQPLDRRHRRLAHLDGRLVLFLKVWQPAELWTSPALRTPRRLGRHARPRRRRRPATNAATHRRQVVADRAGCRGSSSPWSRRSGARAGSRGGQPALHLELRGPGPAQRDHEGAAGGREADAGSRRLPLHLHVLHRHRHADRGDHLRPDHALLAPAPDHRLRRDDLGAALLADHHRGDARDRHAHPLRRRRRHARPRLRGHRHPLPVLRHPARLARRRADRARTPRRTCSSAGCRRSPRSSSACRGS